MGEIGVIWWALAAAWIVLIFTVVPPAFRFLDRHRTAWLRRIREDG